MTDAERWRRLQAEQTEWAQRNFGDAPAWQPLMGIGEGLGEFYEAAGQPEEDDAIGDVCVYALDYCTRMGWDMAEIVGLDAYAPVHDSGGSILLGRLNHAHLKQAQGIRGNEDHEAKGKEALAGLLQWLNYGDDLLDIAEDVWSLVKQRDWKASAKTGVTP